MVTVASELVNILLGHGTKNPVHVVKVDGSELSGVIGISAGHNHTMYLKHDGTVWAAGWNTNGEVGDNTTDKWCRLCCAGS